MRRRAFLAAISGAAVALPLAAGATDPGSASPAGRHLIGYLDVRPVPSLHRAFESGLREHGLEPGRDVRIDYREAGGRIDHFDAIAAEFVAMPVDLIVAPSTTAALAARKATAQIPIVTMFAGDPVGSGLVENLAHPGGNVTGTTSQGVDFATKHLELLAEAIPSARRVAVLTITGNPPNERGLREIEKAAAARTSDELAGAFAAIDRHHAEGLVVFDAPQTFEHRERIIALALERRLGTIFQQKLYVEAGGLLSFGPDTEDLARRAAGHVAKILRGSRPADLPMEQPTRFELAANLRTARAIGITLAPSLLARADEVIE
jgi:putative tryptophan/tyrosine transport system substrate-binding protein